MNPPRAFLVLWWGSRALGPDRGLRKPGKKDRKSHKNSSFGGCAACLDCGTLPPAVDTNREEGNAVEKYGLSIEELAAQSRVELLPDRIEMGRRRNRVRVTCANQQQGIALLLALQAGANICPVQVGNF